MGFMGQGKGVKTIMSIVESGKISRETANYQSTDLLFEAMDRRITGLIEQGAEDLIPHSVLSHGFMEWERLLFGQFPELAWRGKDTEVGSSLTYEQREHYLYERFFLRVKELPAFRGREEESMVNLKEAGWKEYLED